MTFRKSSLTTMECECFGNFAPISMCHLEDSYASRATNMTVGNVDGSLKRLRLCSSCSLRCRTCCDKRDSLNCPHSGLVTPAMDQVRLLHIRVIDNQWMPRTPLIRRDRES